MGRALIIVHGDADRKRAAEWACKAYEGTRIEFKASRRTLPQNDRMWAMLTAIAKQKRHCGQYYPTETWKALFMHALGQEMRFLPALDGKEVVPIGYRTSKLSKEEMGDLLTLIEAWGVENGVVFNVDTTA